MYLPVYIVKLNMRIHLFYNKTDLHDITEILLKVALNTINQANKQCILKIINAFFSI